MLTFLRPSTRHPKVAARAALLTIALLAVALPAPHGAAADPTDPHQEHDIQVPRPGETGRADAVEGAHAQQPVTASAAGAAAAEAFAAVNDRMHQAMAMAFTGDPDIDFARGMIPHHEGAIDMAAIVLEHGTDPEIRALAEQIIAAQEAEIAFLRAWLAAHDAAAPTEAPR